MKRIKYITLICLLIIASLGIWRLCAVKERTKDTAPLMPLFVVGDTLDSETQRIWTIYNILRRDDIDSSTNDSNKIFQMYIRTTRQQVLPSEIQYLSQLTEEEREARAGLYHGSVFPRGTTIDEAIEGYKKMMQEAALTDEEREFLNEIIKTRKITMEAP